jgi:hypothetical protein
VSLPGREPSHSVDGVASLSLLNSSSPLKARVAKLHHAATDIDREDNHAPGSDLQRNSSLTPQLRLDNRTSKFAFTQLVEKATLRIAGNFLRRWCRLFPIKSTPY